ncbi:MAG: histidine kinase [Sphingomonadaceae bacterium]|nr:histidine kinase [Sphingomonadaceae bacterium]MCP5392205.1 histidine kinase [Sphingomonadaceae bacterium]MCP5392641.1 histidine kinase [Sphingomonadaceae bacterium]
MAVLPFRPTPFFANKNRAFWNLQFAGWGGAFLLRAVSGLANGQDSAFFLTILIESITGFSISLVLSVIYRQLINRRPLVAWGVSGLVMSAAVLLFAFIGTWVTSLTRGPGDASFTALIIGYLIYPLTLLGAWSALYYAINFFLQIEEQADRLERLEAEATSAQLAMLRYQLNPHFLFNTLNSISTLVLLKETAPANAMLTRLSSFLRQTLVTDPGGKVTLAQEVETLKLYLGIEKMRFEERLRTEFEVEPEAAKAQLPAMLLQPLVENAIKYAVSPQEEGARISLAARLVGQRLRVTVSDTGPGLPADGKQHSLPDALTGHGHTVSTGVGLANIRDRLSQAYGEDHLFEIRTPATGGFAVTIEIPFETETDEEPLPQVTRVQETTSPALLPPAVTSHPIGT